MRSDCRQIQKRSDGDVIAPPTGYLPAQDYEDDDLSGYNARKANSEDETETTTASMDEDTTTSNVRKALATHTKISFFLKKIQIHCICSTFLL